MQFTDVNFLAALVSAIAAFAIGALWYSPVLFGKAWQKELGFSDEYLRQGNMVMTMGIAFVMMFIMAVGMAMLLQSIYPPGDIMGGVHLGLFVGILFAGTAVAINYVYQRRSWRLWGIDAMYMVVFLVIMGVILAAWR